MRHFAYKGVVVYPYIRDSSICDLTQASVVAESAAFLVLPGSACHLIIVDCKQAQANVNNGYVYLHTFSLSGSYLSWDGGWGEMNMTARVGTRERSHARHVGVAASWLHLHRAVGYACQWPAVRSRWVPWWPSYVLYGLDLYTEYSTLVYRCTYCDGP